MSNFDHYAHYYDLLYRDKDYDAEAGYVCRHLRERAAVKRVFELGCGTGAHAAVLVADGYSVTGIDTSETMLQRAQKRRESLPSDLRAAFALGRGDVRDFRLDQTFDAAISLFHVMSYQQSNRDLAAAFATAARHLLDGGMFLFDFWYGPAVLSQKPETRVKELEDEQIRVIRIAQSQLRENENLVNVSYRLLIEEKATGERKEINETHVVRYLFLPEIDALLDQAGMRRIAAKEWMTDEPLSVATWSGCVVAQRASR